MRKTLTLGLVLAVFTGGLLGAPPASAVTKATNHAVTVASSDNYIIYEVAKGKRNIQPNNLNGGKLYLRDKGGKITRLSTFTDGEGALQLVGQSLLQTSYTTKTVDGVTYGVQKVHQRNIRTGAEVTFTLDPNNSLASAAPDGYVVRYDSGEGDNMDYVGFTSLTWYHADGSTQNIAVPFADGGAYALQASDHGLIAVTPGSDEATKPSRLSYMSWNNPGHWHEIYNAGQPRYISCATASSTHVACRVAGRDSAGPGLVLLRLRDGHATWLKKTHPKTCAAVYYTTRGSSLYALAYTDAGSCVKGTLYRLDDKGKLVTGSKKYRYSSLSTINTGYGKIIVGKGDQSRIYAVTGVTKKPVTLVKV